MKSTIPSVSDVQDQLRGLGPAQLLRLASFSGVPITTLNKIRGGVTRNPGLMTVRQFLPFVAHARAAVVGAA